MHMKKICKKRFRQKNQLFLLSIIINGSHSLTLALKKCLKLFF
jgi:hypothetical protein